MILELFQRHVLIIMSQTTKLLPCRLFFCHLDYERLRSENYLRHALSRTIMFSNVCVCVFRTIFKQTEKTTIHFLFTSSIVDRFPTFKVCESVYPLSVRRIIVISNDYCNERSTKLYRRGRLFTIVLHVHCVRVDSPFVSSNYPVNTCARGKMYLFTKTFSLKLLPEMSKHEKHYVCIYESEMVKNLTSYYIQTRLC